MMKFNSVFVNTTFLRDCRMGTVAVVVAATADEAAKLLNEEIVKMNVKQEHPVRAEQMVRVDRRKSGAMIMFEGDH